MAPTKVEFFERHNLMQSFSLRRAHTEGRFYGRVPVEEHFEYYDKCKAEYHSHPVSQVIAQFIRAKTPRDDDNNKTWPIKKAICFRFGSFSIVYDRRAARPHRLQVASFLHIIELSEFKDFPSAAPSPCPHEEYGGRKRGTET